MSGVTCATTEALHTAVRDAGYAFVHGAAMREMLGPTGARGLGLFAASWNELEVDTYMADGGRYRRRRHAVFGVAARERPAEPHQPHYQTLEYNPLNGGIARWFERIAPRSGTGATLQTGSRSSAALRRWRAVARGASRSINSELKPAAARKGGRRPKASIATASTTCSSCWSSPQYRPRHHLDPWRRRGTAYGEFTLTEPFDSALLDDTRVSHGVTPVQPIDPTAPGLSGRSGGDVAR